MMKLRTILLLFSSILFLHCGSSVLPFTPLKKPIAISQPSQDILYQNDTTRLLYVADQFTQSLVVIDTLREELVDTADEDDFDFTPIPVGGEPVAVAVDNTTTPHRVFVADQFNKRIFAYQVGTIDQNRNLIPYVPVSLGGTIQGISSRPLFKNEGAASSPTMTNVTVDPTVPRNEGWRVKYVGNSQYEVTGTRSGLQSKHAVEGKTYTSDDAGLSFFISAGGEETTDDDSFFFSTMTAKPLELAATPVDLLINDSKMYILTKNAPSIIVYNLATLSIDTTIAVPDINAVPLKMTLGDGKIYISNASSGDIYSLDTLSNTLATISTGITGGVKSIGIDGDRLYLVHNIDSRTSIWLTNSSTIESTLNFSDFGNAFIFSQNDTLRMGLIPNTSGNVDVINLDSLTRYDTSANSITVFQSVEFFDVLPTSSPELISVNTLPGVSVNESWQMTYEGVVGDLSAKDGTVSGKQITVSGIDFQTAGIQAGDIVIISNTDQDNKVASIDGPTTLTLTSTPAVQGSTQFSVLAAGSYVVTGSKSGVQKNRVTSGVAYTSDKGEISLQTRPSFDASESRGDFFSFLTLDTIDPIIVSSQSMAVAGISLNRTSDQRPFAYVLEQTFGQIAILDLVDYSVHKLL